jgi:hypothetical protein
VRVYRAVKTTSFQGEGFFCTYAAQKERDKPSDDDEGRGMGVRNGGAHGLGSCKVGAPLAVPALTSCV